jgi:hypothetical protein
VIEKGRKMRQTSEDNYVADDGHRMQREYGLSPEGLALGGIWVLRGPDATWLGCSRYMVDLLKRFGFVLS